MTIRIVWSGIGSDPVPVPTGHVPRRRDGDPPDVNGLERRLAPAGPSFVLDVDG